MLTRRVFFTGFAASGAALVGGCGAGSSACDGAQSVLLDRDGTSIGDDLMKPGPLGKKAFGRAGAPVAIIEYASLTCPDCRQFHLATYPKLKRTYIDTGKVRYIIREFPIGRSAAAAAIVTQCAPSKSYARLYDRYLTTQKQWGGGQKVNPDALYKIAAKMGMSRGVFDKCMTNQAIIDGLIWVKQRGASLGSLERLPSSLMARKCVARSPSSK